MSRVVEDVVREWNDALRRDGGERLHAHLERRSLDLGLRYGNRSVCQVLRPFFLARERYEALLERVRLLVPAVHAAWGAALADPALFARLRFDAEEERIVRADHGFGAADLVGRLDSFVDGEGRPRFMEYNGESPGGIAFGDMLGLVFDETEPMREQRQRRRFSRVPAVPAVVEAFRRQYARLCLRYRRHPKAQPTVAIVDLADIPTRGEFEIFRAAFDAAGMPCRVAAESDLRIDDEGRAHFGDFEADIIYRRLVTRDLLERFGGHHELIGLSASRRVLVADGFEGYGLCSKGLFALLSDPDLRPKHLSTSTLRVISESIPWTRLCEEGATTTAPGDDGGERQALEEIARREQSHLVLKPSGGYGGKGVILGWRTGVEEWRQAYRDACRGAWVLQDRIPLASEPFPVFRDGAVELVDLNYDLDPYWIGGESIGVGVRLSGHEILNVASGLGSAAPVFLVE